MRSACGVLQRDAEKRLSMIIDISIDDEAIRAGEVAHTIEASVQTAWNGQAGCACQIDEVHDIG